MDFTTDNADERGWENRDVVFQVSAFFRVIRVIRGEPDPRCLWQRT